MSVVQIKNDQIAIEVNTHGAELVRLTGNASGREYLYDAQPHFWNRHSPVLFPIVGSLKDKEYRYEGKTYTLGQHGFARDSEFRLIEEKKDRLCFELKESEESLKNYPFRFALRCGFTLEENRLKVDWEVENPDDEKPLYFSIGAHPAFFCRVAGTKGETADRIIVGDDKAGKFSYYQIGGGGLAVPEVTYEMDADFPAVTKTFDNDALIIPCEKIHRLAFAEPDGTEYVRMTFDAPLLGIWTPVKALDDPAPFVCMEPWYGRCDREGFAGDFTEKDYVMKLAPGERFTAYYTVELPLEKAACPIGGIC